MFETGVPIDPVNISGRKKSSDRSSDKRLSVMQRPTNFFFELEQKPVCYAVMQITRRKIVPSARLACIRLLHQLNAFMTPLSHYRTRYSNAFRDKVGRIWSLKVYQGIFLGQKLSEYAFVGSNVHFVTWTKTPLETICSIICIMQLSLAPLPRS